VRIFGYSGHRRRGSLMAMLGKENTEFKKLITGTHDVFTHISGLTGKIKEQPFWDLPFRFMDREAVARLVGGGYAK
jgi:TRAP-type C4-dicarboxylate transport system substrate-binding protein